MKKGLILALLCAAVLLCAGIYSFIPRETEPEPTPEPTAFPVLSVRKENITALSWDNAARTLHFQRTDEGWICLDDEEFPLVSQNAPRFAALLNAITQLHYHRYLSDVTDPAEYGLDVPSNVITFTCDGSETRLTVGTQNPVTFEYYLQVSGDESVYLIDSTLPQAFSCGLFDLIETDPIPDFATATEYRANGRTYHKNESGEWLDSDGTAIETDLSAVLANLDYAGCIDYYADYYEAHHEYALTDGKTVSVAYSANGEEAVWTLAFSHDYDENHVIVSPTDSDLVYIMDKATADTLLAP